MNFFNRTTLVAALAGLCLGSLSATALQADDTEIFYGHSSDAFNTNPNVLFVLDTSGSMDYTDEGFGDVTRMERLKMAMNQLLDVSSDFNVGMLAFQGWREGGAVRYPVGYLEGSSEELCEGVCPSEVVVAYPSTGMDDATQNDATGAVDIGAPSLRMANVTTSAASAPPTAGGPTITESVVAVADVAEYLPMDGGQPRIKTNQVDTTWFYYGADGYRKGHFGYRFDNVQIPPNATITEATITFKPTSVNAQKGSMGAYISAEATPQPTAYFNGSNGAMSLAERRDPVRRTNALVPWEQIPPNDTTSVGSEVVSPDIAPILREIASLPGWVSGNSVSFLVDPFDAYLPSTADVRKFRGSGAASGQVPVLTYTYVDAPDPDVSTATITATAHVDEFQNRETLEVSRNQSNKTAELFFAGNDNNPRLLAFRFDNINIPKGSTINTAYLSLTTGASDDVPDTADQWQSVAGTSNNKDAPPTAPQNDSPPQEEPVVVEPSPQPTAVAPVSSEPVAFVLRAEKNSTPEQYDQTVLGNRDFVTEFVTWENVPSDQDLVISSPNLSAIIAEVVNLPAWDSGHSVSLMLSATETQIHAADRIRRILTDTSDNKPTLKITWDPPASGTGPTTETQTTAIRFTSVDIPPGATIDAAKIVFHSAEASAEPTTLEIRGQAIPDAPSFTATANDIGSRQRTSAMQPWTPPQWGSVGNQFESPDLSRIVQEITAQNDWCGGNSMAFLISGTGERTAISADTNPLKAPRLEVTYSPGSVPDGAFCTNASLAVPVAHKNDDAVQSLSSKKVYLDDADIATEYLDTSERQLIGLRFRSIPLERDANITSAVIQLTSSRAITDSTNIDISIQNSGNAARFRSIESNISKRSWSSPIGWTSVGPVSAGETTQSVDISSLVRTVLARSNWDSGNAMAFQLAASSANAGRKFVSFDSNESLAAKLVIQYEGVKDSSGTQFKDNLKQHVNELVAEGGTPIVASLYEAALYFRGQAVDYGRRRGAQEYNDRYHRVSHPYSYEGGTLNRPSDCYETDLDSETCIMETIDAFNSTPMYRSPIESQCQVNHIVLLSDGEPTSNTAVSKIEQMMGSSCVEIYHEDSSFSETETCGRELTKWLFETDHNPALPGKQNVVTHTVAFNLEAVHRTFLSDMAREGGGGAYTADSALSLLNAFKSIFTNVSKVDSSFVAPSATLNQTNRMKNREDLYFAMFKPEAKARWPGNLKKYKLQAAAGQAGIIVDKNDIPAVDENSGEFKDSAHSFWSSQPDGSSVELGGAAEQIAGNGYDHTYRKVYTYTGTNTLLSDPGNALLPDNTNLDKAWFKLPPEVEDDQDYYTELVNWAHGQDVNDVDNDSNTSEPRGEMGDPMHAQPVILNYANGSGTSSIVYVSTNEGYVHAIDTATGEEKFAFIPRELLKNLRILHDNEPTLNRPYGLDGGMTTWVDDTNNNGVIDTGEKAYLYIGMRRGGSHYYALDVSNPSSPRYLWSIAGRSNTLDTDSTTADGDFLELGDTWSRPIKSRVQHGSQIVDVLIFGGGYDTNQDPMPEVSGASNATLQTRSVDSTGRAIFIVNALTGKLLWQTNLSDPRFKEMQYSIPSEVRVIDVDFDGLADQLYVGDMGGQLWRVDIDNNSATSDTLENRIDAGIIAQLAGDAADEARRFYYPPDISIISVGGEQQLAISIGSGWRAHPLDTVVQDRFYSLRLPYVYGKPLDSFGRTVYPLVDHDSTGLIDVTNDKNADVSSIIKGWFINLDGSGEKALSPSVTADHKILFTSYLPAVSAQVCSAAEGSGAIYALSVYNGAPVLNLDDSGSAADLTLQDRRAALDRSGIPPATSLLFPELGDATVVVGTETIEEFKIEELRRRTFWQEMIEEGS